MERKNLYRWRKIRHIVFNPYHAQAGFDLTTLMLTCGDENY
jgi:hypothetical protein